MTPKRVVIKEEEYQGLPGILKDPSRFCRVVRKQSPVSTACLALKYRVSRMRAKK